MPFSQTPSPLSNILAAKTYNAAWFSGGSKEAQITAAIAAAVTDGALYVYVPSNMLPYTASSVTFNTTVKMMAEGWDNFNVKAYGASGNGTTDDYAAIQGAINAAAVSGGDINFPPGTYITSAQLNAVSTVNFVSNGGLTVIKAKDSSTFEAVLKMDGVANVVLSRVVLDANQANRIASLASTQRVVGLYINNSTDIRINGVTSKNAAGSFSGIPGFGFAVGGTTSARVTFSDCVSINNGIVGRGCDGYYIGGAQCLITNSISNNNTDTGFVLENCTNSGIKGCSCIDTPAAAAITNITTTDKYGNFIDGLTIDNWNASVTGGIQIGSIGSSTGHLINTVIANITMRRVAGNGPAIYLRKVGTGVIKKLTISNIIIDGAGSAQQGILIDAGAQDISISNGYITAPTCIQTIAGSVRISISNLQLKPTGTYGIYSDGCTGVRVKNCDIDCGGVANYGVYFDGTATGCESVYNNIENYLIGRVGSSATNIPATLANDTSGYGGVVVGKNHRRAVNYNSATGEVNLDPDAGGIQMSGDYRAVGGFRQIVDGWFYNAVPAGLTAAVMTRAMQTLLCPRAGSLMGIAVRSSNGVVAAGTVLDVEFYVNNLSTGQKATMAIGQSTALLTLAKDVYPIAAGSVVEPRITTAAGWTAVTMNLQVSIELET